MNSISHKDILVSIVIPVYNGAKYLSKAIESALVQDYKNIEVIVVNDGSTDDTEIILNKYIGKIRYIKKNNGGVASALNVGIKASSGEYISWLSHDDCYKKNKISSQIGLLKSKNANVDGKTIVYSNYETINEQGQIIGVTAFEEIYSEYQLNDAKFPILRGIIHGCSLLIPKRCFEEVGYFNEKLRYTQDYDLWYRLFPRYNVYFDNKVLIQSRSHSEQDSKKATDTNEVDKLWITFIKEQLNISLTGLFGSKRFFLNETYKLLKSAKYNGAINYLENEFIKMREQNISGTLVSIIIPFHNRIDLLLEAIVSVQRQTHRNLELILIDDASTESLERIKTIIKSDKRIKLIKNQRKKGRSGARNTGIDVASGEYIGFLDSDDLFMENKIEVQLKYMVENNYSITHTSYTLLDKNADSEEVINSAVIDYGYPHIINQCSIATPTVMVEKGVFSNSLIRFSEELDVGEDICLWIKIANNYSFIKGIDRPLSKVRIHTSSTSEDELLQLQGLVNIFNFCIKNGYYKSGSSALADLNKKIFDFNAHYYNLVNSKEGGKKGFISKLKAIIKKILLLNPIYLKLEKLDSKIDKNHFVEKNYLRKILEKS